MPGLVKCRAHQVIHCRINDGKTLAFAGLEEFDAGQQQAGIANQPTAGFQHHLEAAPGQLVEQGSQIGSHRWLSLVILVTNSQAAPEVEVVDFDTFHGQLVNQGQNAVQCFNERRGIK